MPPEASLQPLRERVTESMTRWHVPGVAVGVLHDGQEHVAGFGVTNVDPPPSRRESRLAALVAHPRATGAKGRPAVTGDA